MAITTDVIVGFPGETEADAERSLAAVDALRFARVHAFPYSARPATTAAALEGRVDAATLRRRMASMLEVARSSAAAFAHDQVGSVVGVLWERRRRGGWHGTSDNYLRVRMPSDRDLRRQLSTVRLLATDGDELRGEALA